MKKKSIGTKIKNTGVCYARFSSHNQKDVSIEQQIMACRKKADEFNITITETYEDRAISGKTDIRPSFQKLLRDAENGKFEYLIAWKSNRIGRNMMEQLINESRLQSYGVRILYVEESFDDTAAGRFAARNMMNVNQFYSENMAEDILRAMNDNASKCLVNGPLPFGYKRGADGRYELNENTAPIALEIFERVSKGEKFIDIEKSLNIRGIRTATGSDWNRSSFQRMLSNERYRGVYKWSDTRIEGGIPRIVSDELFYKVQEVLKMKNNPRGRHRVFGDYLLTGKLFCGHCGSAMVGYSGTSKSGVLHHYYVCNNKRLKRKCKKKNIQRGYIEQSVVSAIQQYVFKPDVIEWIADNAVKYYTSQEAYSDIIILERQLLEIEKAIKNLLSAIEKGIITDSTRDRLVELENEKSDLKIKISIAKSSVVNVSKNDIVAGLHMFRDGDINDKMYCIKLFDAFLVAVYLYDDHLKLVFNFTGKNNTLDVSLQEIERKISDVSASNQCSYNLLNGSP